MGGWSGATSPLPHETSLLSLHPGHLRVPRGELQAADLQQDVRVPVVGGRHRLGPGALLHALHPLHRPLQAPALQRLPARGEGGVAGALLPPLPHPSHPCPCPPLGPIPLPSPARSQRCPRCLLRPSPSQILSLSPFLSHSQPHLHCILAYITASLPSRCRPCPHPYPFLPHFQLNPVLVVITISIPSPCNPCPSLNLMSIPSPSQSHPHPQPSPIPVPITLIPIRMLSPSLSHCQPHPNPIPADITVLIPSPSQSHPCPHFTAVPMLSLSLSQSHFNPFLIPVSPLSPPKSPSVPCALGGYTRLGPGSPWCCHPWVLTRCPRSAGSS